jgi:hypothetical protein
VGGLVEVGFEELPIPLAVTPEIQRIDQRVAVTVFALPGEFRYVRSQRG